MYVIRGSEQIELTDDSRLIARPNRIVIVVDENDPTRWHGSAIVDNPPAEGELQPLGKDSVLTVTFDYGNQRFMGLIRITSMSADCSASLSIGFRGIDVFRMI